jgi:predicted metal-dependent hydrolase
MLQVGSVEALVVRKPIKNLHLSVLPPAGKVRVTAPFAMNDDAIRTLMATRIAWIRKQQAKFSGQERQTRREYVSGESHYLWGQRYRLEVIYDGVPSNVTLKGKDKLVLSVRPNSDRSKREQVMMDWYRKELRAVASELFEQWQKTIGVQVSAWGIKRMKTRWGTCNQKAGRIWLNLELAKKPEHCLDFIIVHELTHLLERKHDNRFKSYMDKFMPKWRQYKEELNQSILSHEKWEY